MLRTASCDLWYFVSPELNIEHVQADQIRTSFFRRRKALPSLWLMVAGFLALPCAAEALKIAHPGAARAASSQEEGLRIPDVWVTDQDGRRVRFYTDLIKGKAAVINFFYTSCEASCLMQREDIVKLQRMVGPHALGKINFVSITLDPSGDSPGRLKAWSKRLKARPGWTLVTGRQQDIDALLLAFIGYKPRKEQHGQSPVFVAGDDATGRWKQVSALDPIEDIASHILKVMSGY